MLCTFNVYLCSVAVKEDSHHVVQMGYLGGHSSLVLRKLHTVIQLSCRVERHHCVVQLHHSRWKRGEVKLVTYQLISQHCCVLWFKCLWEV